MTHRTWLLLAALALGCRTAPVELPSTGPSDLGMARDAAAPGSDAATTPGGSVNCGPGMSCAIADGEHCCDSSPLQCATAACNNSNQFDCDGPEDCAGGLCCFPIRNAFSRAACASSCENGSVLCHSTKDCPANMVCCLNFVLGPQNGLCLGACD
jgi:hypothetical protein